MSDGKWNGAEHLKKTHMVNPDGSRNKHWSGLVSKETGAVVDPTYRDIGHVFPFLMKE